MSRGQLVIVPGNIHEMQYDVAMTGQMTIHIHLLGSKHSLTWQKHQEQNALDALHALRTGYNEQSRTPLVIELP